MENNLSKRGLLIKMTQEAEKRIKNGFAGSHNRAILQIYREQGKGEIFRTIEGWNKNGFMVEKGQKALPLWAKGSGNLNTRPLIYIFSNQQVFKVNDFSKAPVIEREPRTAPTHVNI